jgi:HAT1-interacting factor 1
VRRKRHKTSPQLTRFSTTAEPTKPADAPKPTLEEAVERARRAYALGHFDEAVDNYAVALELQCVAYSPCVRSRTDPCLRSCRTEKHGDHAPENADLYFAYGKALLEHAVSQSSVLGKEQTEDGADDGPGTLYPLRTSNLT